MELREFVSQTLVEINQGVKDARGKLEPDDDTVIGGGLNQLLGGATSEHIVNLDSGNAAHLVHFDVALTVADSESVSGGGKLTVASILSLSGSAGNEQSSSETSRIRFTVPISFAKAKKKRSYAPSMNPSAM